MSRALSNSGTSGGFRALRDYGATSSSNSSGNASTALPDVNFAGFSPTEFMSLSENIAQNIGSVKSNWQSLEKAAKRIGTANDTATTRDKVHTIQSTTNRKIKATNKDLKRLTEVVRHGDKQQKLHVEKLTSDFQKIVQLYSSSQHEIATLMKGSLLTANASTLDDLNQDAGGTNTSGDADQQVQQRTNLLRQQLEFEQGMAVEREQRVRLIEADVLDVNEIMRDLGVLISQQGENIDTIESRIDHATGNVEDGTSELMKAARSQAQYRKKVLLLLVIAVIIGLIVTGIIVSQLKS